jgi:dolichyl-phosphate-mannose-protein mannosyltransferase
MNPRFARGLACLLGAALCAAAFFVWSDWSNGYLQGYLTFAPSFGEVAFRLHMLILVLPAVALVSIAVAGAPALPRRLLQWFDALRDAPARRGWPIALAVVVLALAAAIRFLVLDLAPITDDEHVYQFQARLLTSGRLYADSPPAPVRAFFDNQFIVNNGKWFGSYFVGHPAVLALAGRLGLDQWVGPIEGALTFLLVIGIARRIFGERTAVLSGALLVLSPFFLFLSATQLSQPTSALMLALFWYAALRIEAAPRVTGWWAAGAAALAFGMLTRPQTTVFLSLPFVIRLAARALGGRLSPGWAPPALAAAILAGGAAIFFSIDYALTGHPLRTGYHAYMAQGIEWLFPFGPYYTIREISRNIVHVNFWLFGWPVSLAFAPFFRRGGAATALAAVPVVAVIWYGLVAVPTVATVGPVYYGEIIGPLVVLSASGIERVVTLARARRGESLSTRALVVSPWVASFFCLIAFLPVHVSSIRLSQEIVRAPYEMVAQKRLDNAVVFVHSLPSLLKQPGTWVHFHRNNSPDLTDRVLFVKDLGPERNRDLMRYLPTRSFYIMGMRNLDLVLLPVAPAS